MKKVVFVIALIGLIVAAASAHAQVYDPYANPYGYGAYAPADAYPQVYDPYYQLHVIHYQLYLGQYGYYPYPYFVPAVPVAVAPPAVVAGPVRQPLRTTVAPVRRR